MKLIHSQPHAQPAPSEPTTMPETRVVMTAHPDTIKFMELSMTIPSSVALKLLEAYRAIVAAEMDVTLH